MGCGYSRGVRTQRTAPTTIPDRSPGGLAMLVDALAVYRLVKLVKDDRITEPIRDGMDERLGPPEESSVSYLLNCPWCLSFWFGSALTLARLRWPRTTEALARSLALSATTGLAAQHLD